MTPYPLDIGIAADASKMLAMSGDKSLGVANFVPFLPWQALNQIGTGFMGEEAKFREDKLRAEIAALKQELAAVKQEKAKLEILLGTLTERRNSEVYQMQIEIDQNKRSHQVAAIIQTDYFQQLLAEVEMLRS